MPLQVSTPSIASKTQMTSDFVLDASIALAWYFQDESDSYADAIAEKSVGIDIYVPPVWHLEVTNSLLVGERRKRTTPLLSADWVARLFSTFHILVDEHMATHAFGDTLSLARIHNLSAYDAAYLELALRRNLPLATLDRQMAKAAKKAGVSLYKV